MATRIPVKVEARTKNALKRFQPILSSALALLVAPVIAIIPAEAAPNVPVIVNVTPRQGYIGTPVVITGADFGAPIAQSSVTFNGVNATLGQWDDNMISTTVPEGATTGPVVVETSAGVSNGVHFTVNGTPQTTETWYLAEGSTAWGFGCYINIVNPSSVYETARVTYMTTSGPIDLPDINLPPTSQTTLFPRDSLGPADFSTKVVALKGGPIAVDRTMSWPGTNGQSGDLHCSIGVTSPSLHWYLPEGSSNWNFETWLLVQNPDSERTSTCTIKYMIENGTPVTVHKSIPPNSRRTFNMADDIGQKDASIEVLSDIPVIPERSMYRNARQEGHDSVGTNAPASDYYLAEGTTGHGFTTYVLVQNPNASEAHVDITYMTSDGPVLKTPFVMPAYSRKTIRANDDIHNKDISTQVHADVPIIAERSMYWESESGEKCHDSIGVSKTHDSWFMPDGMTIDNYETWTLVQNPNTFPVDIQVGYCFAGGGSPYIYEDTLPAKSRRTYGMEQDVGPGVLAAGVVDTFGGKVIVERSMYGQSRGWGTNTIGGYWDVPDSAGFNKTNEKSNFHARFSVSRWEGLPNL